MTTQEAVASPDDPQTEPPSPVADTFHARPAFAPTLPSPKSRKGRGAGAAVSARAEDLFHRNRLANAPAPFVLPELLNLLRKVDRNRLADVRDCGQYSFRGSCGCGKRAVPRTCEDRLCPHCERRRAIQAVDRYSTLFDDARYARHLVLTVRTVPLGGLAEGMRLLRNAFRRLRQKLLSGFVGGVYSMEIKGEAAARDRRGGWHPHIHALIYGMHIPKKLLVGGTFRRVLERLLHPVFEVVDTRVF